MEEKLKFLTELKRFHENPEKDICDNCSELFKAYKHDVEILKRSVDIEEEKGWNRKERR